MGSEKRIANYEMVNPIMGGACLAPTAPVIVVLGGDKTMKTGPQYTFEEALEAFIDFLKNGGSKTTRPISDGYEKQLRYQITRFYSHGDKAHPKSFFCANWCEDEHEKIESVVKNWSAGVCDRNKLIRYLRQFWAFCAHVPDSRLNKDCGLSMDEFRVNPANGRQFRMKKEPSRIKIVSEDVCVSVVAWFRRRYKRTAETDFAYAYEALRNLAHVGFLYYSAVRPCEAVALNREDITDEDFENGYFTISAEQTKNREENRSVLLPHTGSKEREELIQYLSLLDKIFAGWPTSTGPLPLFPHADGTRQGANNLQKNLIADLARKDKNLGLPQNWTLYQLRHNVATRMARANIALPLIANAMGHKNYSTTQLYMHLTGNDMVSASLQAFEAKKPKAKTVRSQAREILAAEAEKTKKQVA